MLAKVGLIALIALAAVPASSQSLESMQSAQQLGTVIASEKTCGLTLNQPGIEAWIASNVRNDDLEFASTLMMMTQGTEFQLAEMSASSRTAHCAAVRHTAKSMGLID